MCGPAAIPIAMLVLTTVSTAAGISAQQRQMKMQEAANEQQYQNTMSAYRGNLANIEVQRSQAAENASQQINLNNKAGRIAQSTAYTASGEAGVTGTSVDALLRDLSGKAGYDNTNVEANYLRQNYALNVRRENAYNQTASDINSLKTPTMPDYLGGVLRIGQAGLGAYSQYQQNQAIIKNGAT